MCQSNRHAQGATPLRDGADVRRSFQSVTLRIESAALRFIIPCLSGARHINGDHGMKTLLSKAIRITAALAIALAVSGCVIYPAGPPHPYHWGWYR
jgi:hypothetical protein